MTQRDWQKDMEIATQLKLWKVDPGGEEDGAAFYTINEDGIHTTVHADNMLGTDAELLHESLVALPYWLQEAKELQEIVSGRGRELLRHRDLLGGLNDELTVTEDRADAAEYREKCLKEAWEQLREIVSTNATGGKGEDINDYDIMLNMMDDLLYLASLYPDTPAPIGEERGTHE